VLFHSNRPLLVETYTTKQVVTSPAGGTWTQLGGTVSSGISVVDNAALFGIGADLPADSARYWSHGATAPGSSGNPGQYGGWNLIINFVPLGTFTGTASAYGAGWFQSGTSIADIGPFQPASTTYHNCGFAVDLLQRIGVSPALTSAAYSADPSGAGRTVQANTKTTSGETPRLFEIWTGTNSNIAGASGLVTAIPSPLTAVTGTTPLSSSTLNTSIQQTFNLLNYPPMLNINTYVPLQPAQTGQAITPNFTTPLIWPGTPLQDNFSAFTAASSYVVPTPGLYFVHSTVVLQPGAASGQFAAGINVNGTDYWGGWYNTGSLNSQTWGCAVTKILDLQQFDRVAIDVKSTVQCTVSTTFAGSSHFIAAWLAPVVTGTQTWTNPEVTGFTFQAATPPGTGAGQLANLLNTKLANDVNFLLKRPYATVKQTSAQTGLAVNVPVSITMNSVAGLVHGSAGDNYAGWSSGSNWYAAPVPGWYLAVEEISYVPGNAASVVTAGFSVPTSGGLNSPTAQPDWYQALQVPAAGANPGGATAVGVYYLNTGEHIQPCARYQSGTAATWSTDTSHGFNSHFEVMWLSN